MSDDRPLPADLELVAYDVDGVFTDGRFWLADDGSERKAFHTQDGCGVRRLLQAGIAVAVISGRASNAVEIRMSELGVEHVFLKCADKAAAFDALLSELQIDASKTACVGDDLPDLPLLRRAGFPIAVANAVAEVKDECLLTTQASGGDGAVREICDLILEARNR